MMQRSDDEQSAANKVTLIGALINAVLGVIKIVIGVLYHSAGLVADGIHSLSDLFTDILVLVALKISGEGPDDDHPWGHAHFETLATAILGSILIAVAGIMAYDSLLSLFTEDTTNLPGWPTIVVALIAIASKEWIYHYTLRIGKALKSDLLIANAWHSRTDAISSVIVLIGIMGALMGVPWLDAVAAVLVAALVAKIGWGLSNESFKQLVSTALPPEEIAHYKRVIMSIQGIINVHSFKSRAMGSQRVLELHIQVPAYISASEGHRLGDEACRLLQEEGNIGHIIYHIDTYDDDLLEDVKLPRLPLRNELEPIISDTLASLPTVIAEDRVILHYDPNQVCIEIYLSHKDFDTLQRNELSSADLAQKIRTSLEAHFKPELIGSIWIGIGTRH